MHTLPLSALSVRQPWAWAIIHAGKDVENRSWVAVRNGLTAPREVAIHSPAGMTQAEYYQGRDFMAGLGVECPEPAALIRGGIIGSALVAEIVCESASPWFFGPCALVLKHPQPCTPIPVAGMLGYFNWRERRTDSLTEPNRWTLTAGKSRQGELF